MNAEDQLEVRENGFNPLLFPVVFAQGLWVKRITPRLPDAAGPTEGTVAGKSPAFRLIMLGESTVAGIGAPTHEFALTGQTAKSFARLSGRAVHWLALGRSGANARIALAELAPKLAKRHADAVVIALGINDSTGLNSATRWKADILKLVCAIRGQLGDVKIIISGPPPLGSFPAFPKLLRSFLGGRSRILDQALSQLVPSLHNIVHAPMVREMHDRHFCEDKFHPSTAGYAAWGEYLGRHLAEAFFSPGFTASARATDNGAEHC
ncbi:MAG: SGNH/GDSL hydrolase family protein [Blastocatellia bacterium]|nr:SGNH/GDSL hydrolase family protein [Blastocatellia bacterium]